MPRLSSCRIISLGLLLLLFSCISKKDAPAPVAAPGSPTVTVPSALTSANTHLKLYLDASTLSSLADGAAVNTWSDSSASALNASWEVAPGTYRLAGLNGKPSVELDGRYILPDSSVLSNGDSFEVMVVGKFDILTTGGWNEIIRLGADEIDLGFDSGKLLAYVDGDAGNTDKLSTGTVLPDTPYLLSYAKTGTTLSFRINGADAGSETVMASIPLNANTREINYDRKDGSISAVIIFDAPLSGAERTAVEAYLKTKYGL